MNLLHVLQVGILTAVLIGAAAALAAVIAYELEWWRRDRPGRSPRSWTPCCLDCRDGRTCDCRIAA